MCSWVLHLWLACRLAVASCFWCAESASERTAAEPVVWTDGSLVQDKVSGASSSGSFFSHLPGQRWAERKWGILMMMLPVTGAIDLAVVIALFLVLHRLFREQSSGDVILALQAADGIHLGVDNLGVVRHVGRMLDGNVGSLPPELVKDGDLIVLISRIRDRDTVRITKVEGHADGSMVRDGGVRELDRLGNNAADEAADFGRRRVEFRVIDARRNFAGVVVGGTRLFSCIAFLLLSPGLWRIMWMEMVLRVIRCSGLLVLFLRGADWCMPCGIVPFCLDQRAFGMVSGSHLLLHL